MSLNRNRRSGGFGSTAVGAGAFSIGCLGIIALWGLFVAFFSWIFMLLWNVVVHGIFHGPALTWFQAFCVFMLLSIIGNLFKSQSSK